MAKIYGQLEEAQLQNKTANPAAGVAGKIWLNTTDLNTYLDDGTVVRQILRNDQRLVIGNDAAPINNVRINRAGNNKLQFVPGNDATAEGSDAPLLSQVGKRIENYTFATRPLPGNVGRLIYLTDTLEFQIDDGVSWILIAMSPPPPSYAVPVGAMMPFGGAVAPGGYLLCDGSSLSTAVFASLFAVLGTSYGSVGAGFFNLPDLRGRFVRGVDNGAGNDPDSLARIASSPGGNIGDSVGSLQTDGNLSHAHGVTDAGHLHSVTDAGHLHGVTNAGHGHAVTDVGHTHAVRTDLGGGLVDGVSFGTGTGLSFNPPTGGTAWLATVITGLTVNNQPNAGVSVNSQPVSGVSVNNQPVSGVSVNLNGGAESRPKNVYANYIIKSS